MIAIRTNVQEEDTREDLRRVSQANDVAQEMGKRMGLRQVLQRTMSPKPKLERMRRSQNTEMGRSMDHAKRMRRAIAVASRNAKAPFGAVLFDPQDDLPMIEGLNHSMENPTLHGEIDAINRYAKSGRERWSHLTLYTTAEPCCMCQAAILWAGIPRVVFGTSIQTLTELGWNQFRLTAKDVSNAADFADCEIVAGVLEAECDSLFKAIERR